MKIAIIPARGGSKRIPRKNIKLFCGEPMISYSIRAALDSGKFDQVLVSTDDEEIAEYSKSLGADVPFLRPAHLSDDYATTNDVVVHGIEFLGLEADAMVCCIYATAPFITSEDLINGQCLLEENGVKFVFTATEYDFPIQRAFKLNNEGHPEMFQPDQFMTRSQDLEPAYHDAGQFYWGRASAFIEDISYFGEYSLPLLLPSSRVQDIDTPEDWKKAEMLFSLSKKNI